MRTRCHAAASCIPPPLHVSVAQLACSYPPITWWNISAAYGGGRLSLAPLSCARKSLSDRCICIAECVGSSADDLRHGNKISMPISPVICALGSNRHPCCVRKPDGCGSSAVIRRNTSTSKSLALRPLANYEELPCRLSQEPRPTWATHVMGPFGTALSGRIPLPLD